MSGVLGDFVDESSSTRELAPTAVGSQVLIMTVVSLVTIIVFNVLRPNNKIIYEPKVKYHIGNKPPPRISDSVLGWLPPLIRTKEPELLDKIGLDAVAFLRFLRMLRWLFTAMAALACAILIPVDVTFNLANVASDARDSLSMLTIRDVSGPDLYAHVAIEYVFTFLVMIFVYFHWKEMVRLRHTWFRLPEYTESFYARTLMVQKVPKSLMSDEGIRNIFETVQVPYPTTSVHIGRRVGRLPDLIEYYNHTVCELEQVLTRYLKDGKIGKKRPTIRQGGFLFCGGEKKDAIDYYTNKLKRAELAIEDYREHIDTRKPENYGFASMAAVPYAHTVARILRNKRPKGTVISLAPNPKDIIWENLNKSDAAIARNMILGWVFLITVCTFNTLPVLAVSFLANLASLTAYIGFLSDWASSSHTTFAIVSGVLPPAVSALFGFFFPIVMRWLSRYQGAITHSRLDRAVIARYYAFLIISQLVIFTLIGVIFNCVKEIVGEIGEHKSFQDILDNLDTLPSTIHRTYIDQANYWLTFFPLRGFLVVFDLAQIINLFVVWFKTLFLGRTVRDIREWTKPPVFEFAIYYANMLFMAAVAFVFAPLVPLIAVAAAIVFWMSSFVYKYQLMFVFISRVESGGRLWNSAINRLLAGVVLMQLLMILTIGLQDSWRSWVWIATVPPVPIILAFKIFLARKFNNQFKYYNPTDSELHNAVVHSDKSDARGKKLEKRFGHPALHAELFTPMLHAKMMPLLPEVYKGRIEQDSAKLEEYGGQKTEAQVVSGGIKIAAVQQSDLEYDPALYQRDRGELDWDQRSLASTTHLGDNQSMYSNNKPGFYNPSPVSPHPGAYDAYLAHGPQASDEIELSRFDSRVDQLPLLQNQASYAVGDYINAGSTATLVPGYQTPVTPLSHYPPYRDNDPMAPPIPSLPPMQRVPTSDGYREAPVHRPYPPSRQASAWTEGGYSYDDGKYTNTRRQETY